MKRKSIAVIGGGPAGFMAAITAMDNYKGEFPPQVDIFEKSSPLKTILYTGNGRCNLSNNINDFREVASNYPRGEKFLYSVFSRFGVRETIDFFNSKGIKTYVQPDNRIFPESDRAESVREMFIKHAQKYNIKIIKTCVDKIIKTSDGFRVFVNSEAYNYDSVIISTGGNRESLGYKLAKDFGHSIKDLKPALTALILEEKFPKNIAGVSIKDCRIHAFHNKKKKSDIAGDFVFTHKGIAGPAAFNTSSLCAYVDYSPQNPLLLRIDFLPKLDNELLIRDLRDEAEKFPDKSISNALKKYIPKSLAVELLKAQNINPDRRLKELSQKENLVVMKILKESELKAVSPAKDGEIVTAGGVSLNEVNPSTMESKLVKGLFFCGETLDIDGLTGGFNLQLCWSTGYLAGVSQF